MKKETSITVRCDRTIKAKLEEKAEQEGMTFSDFIRWVLRKETKGGE